MTPKSLFDTPSGDTRSRAWRESRFGYLTTSTRASAGRIRDLIDAWFNRLPGDMKEDVRRRFRSFNDAEHLAAFSEILCHALLYAHGFEAKPPVAKHNEKRPDFIVSGRGQDFIVEVVAPGDDAEKSSEERGLSQFYRDINRLLKHPDFLLNVHLVAAGKAAPSAKRAVKFLKERFALQTWEDLTGAQAEYPSYPSWIWKDNGWELSFGPIPKRQEFRGEEPDILAVYGDRVRTATPGEGWLDALFKKAGRYGELDVPYLIFVNGIGMWQGVDSIPDALLGPRAFNVNLVTKVATETRNPGGLWITREGPRYTRVSGVLFVRHGTPWALAQAEIQLWHNPWAALPLKSQVWRIPQYIPSNEKLERQSDDSLVTLFGLPQDWPGAD